MSSISAASNRPGFGLLCLFLAGILMVGVLIQPTKAEVIISESSEPTGTDREKIFFECKSIYCENNKKIRYWWVYDEIVKYRRKYKDLGKISFLSKLSIALGSFRRIFNEKAVLGFYVVRQLKDREILEIGPMQSEYTPPAFFELGQGTIGRAWETGKSIIVQDTTSVPDYVEIHPEIKAEFVYPLIDPQTKRVTAVFVMGSKLGDHFETIDSLGVKVVMDVMEIL